MPTLADAITALRAELAEVEDQYEHDPRFGWDEITLKVGAQVSKRSDASLSLGLDVFGLHGLSGKAGHTRGQGETMELTIKLRRLTAEDGARSGFRGIAGQVTTQDGDSLHLMDDRPTESSED